MTLDVTVVIPTFNRANLLPQAIDSILGQTLSPERIIVVNDGSTDDTLKILKQYNSKIDYFSQDNLGKSAAVNAGVNATTTDWVWVFDDDDIAFSNALRLHADALDHEPNAAYTFSARNEASTDSNNRLIPGRKVELPNTTGTTILHALLDNCFFHLQGSVIRRECFEQLGGFRTDLYRAVDYEFMLRLARHFDGARIEKSTYYLRRHSGDRGPASTRFSVGNNKAHWINNEQKFFREIYHRFEINEYLPERVADISNQTAFCKAMVTRGGAMARKALWDIALADFEAARNHTGDTDVGLKEIDNAYVRKWVGDLFGNEQVAMTLLTTGDWQKRYARCVRTMVCQEDRIYIAQQIYFACKRARISLRSREGIATVRIVCGILGMGGLAAYMRYKVTK